MTVPMFAFQQGQSCFDSCNLRLIAFAKLAYSKHSLLCHQTQSFIFHRYTVEEGENTVIVQIPSILSLLLRIHCKAHEMGPAPYGSLEKNSLENE